MSYIRAAPDSQYIFYGLSIFQYSLYMVRIVVYHCQSTVHHAGCAHYAGYAGPRRSLLNLHGIRGQAGPYYTYPCTLKYQSTHVFAFPTLIDILQRQTLNCGQGPGLQSPQSKSSPRNQANHTLDLLQRIQKQINSNILIPCKDRLKYGRYTRLQGRRNIFGQALQNN